MVDINENGLYLQVRRFERQFPDSRLIAEVAESAADSAWKWEISPGSSGSV